ncbi:MAG: SpoIIE family protein phosphatase [Pseudonocardia sp.]|nr:SpoIIE family protein phosphatase [Pseudonocardia sp.]
MTDGPVTRPLSDPARVRALAEAGLGAEPDPEMEYFADRVRIALAVPVALVSLVRPDQQVFPGMVGLPEPWASSRCTPLSHSFCQHVVRSAEPLVVEDARCHPLVADNLAVRDLGVVAYAGVPLTDSAGNVLGSLCAIDGEPRAWTTGEIDTLHALGRACSTELRLRLALVEAGRERRRRDELEAELRRSFDSSQALLTASQAFVDTTGVADLRARIAALVSGDLAPTYVGISLLGLRGRLRRVHGQVLPDGTADAGARDDHSVSAPGPSATAIREQRIVHYPDRASFDADHPEETIRSLDALGIQAVVAVPMPGDAGPVGSIVLGWDAPRLVTPGELLLLSTIAGYATAALGRAELLRHRTSVADELQRAMLTTLPDVPGLEMAARYEPADSREHVGGDWYDAAPAPAGPEAGAPGHPQGGEDTVLAVSVGDIIGHTLHAATIMGQVRAMVRQAAWDHPGTPPSHTLTALEKASLGLGLDAAGTAILAHLHRPRPDAAGADGPWSMRWSNAGHPPPVLIGPDGTMRLLHDHDCLFGFPGLIDQPRLDHEVPVASGSTLFLYTDGLIEHSGGDLDEGTEALLALLRETRTQTPQQIVDAAVDGLAPDCDDDVVAFAIRFGVSGG